MNSRTKYACVLVASVILAYVIVSGMMGRASAQEGAYPQLSVFMEVINRIQNDYVDSPSITEAIDGAIRGMVERVDPHGGYLSPETTEFYRAYDALASAGIGVSLSKKFDYPVIVAAIPGGPADRAGLGSGDTIEGIDGESLREHNLIEVQQALAGEAGTTVDLTVIRRSRPEPSELRLTREVVAPPPLQSRMLEGNIGYLKVPMLSTGKAAEARAEIEKLAGDGAGYIVLDLRNSAGGNRDEAIELANLFIESGTLGYVEGQTTERETFVADAERTAWRLPLAVLINTGTAEAAEIAAAAIRDNGRGELVGVRTFGLGSVQRLLPLDDGSALLLSVAKYYSPSGSEIQMTGVIPTVEVTAAAAVDPLDLPDPESPAIDRQLDKAIEILIAPVEDQAA